MKIVIGLVGEKGSGKETFVKLLTEVAPKLSIFHTRSSDILAETLEAWGLPKTRENLQDLAIIMKDKFGPATVSNAVAKRIDSSSQDLAIFDGVRWDSDVELIRSFSRNFLIYITADLMIRYERLKERKEKAFEEGTTFEQFMKEEKKENELLIPTIGQSADVAIINNTTLEEFKNKVENFYQTYIQRG